MMIKLVKAVRNIQSSKWLVILLLGADSQKTNKHEKILSPILKRKKVTGQFEPLKSI